MSQLKLILDITFTHLKSRFRQSIIAALGVTFGIGTFIILMSFMTGLNQLLDGLILNRTPHVHIYNEIEPSDQQAAHLYYSKNTLHKIRSIKPKFTLPNIYNASPLIQFLSQNNTVKGITSQVKAQVFYQAGSIELNGVIHGIEPLKEEKLFNFDQYIVEGSPSTLAQTDNGILLGAGIAKKMSLYVGDRIQISSSSGQSIFLKIVGVFQSGLAEIDNVQSYVNLKTAQRLQEENTNYITDINLKLWNIEDAPSLAHKIEKQFALKAVDINTANAQFETGTAIRNMITYAVSITLLIVAGFGIYNILNMMIYEKMNDIAILKATGFSGIDVQNIFLSQALIIGFLGGAAGLLLGFLCSWGIDRLPFETEALPTIKTFPVNFNIYFYIIGIVFALISTFLAGYLPARKARKIDPVEILRGQ